MRSIKIKVVVPVLNEAATIGPMVERCLQTLKGLDSEIIVVDGYSTDGSAGIAEAAGARVVYQKGRGYGAAYFTGFEHALEEESEAILVMIDGDLTYLPEDIQRVIEPIVQGEADLVVGDRFQHADPHAISILNKVGNRFLTWLLNRLYGLEIGDSQCGFRAIKGTQLRRMFLEASGMPMATEMIIEARKQGMKIFQVPVSYKKRLGTSKLRPVRDGLQIAGTTILLLSEFNPFIIFGGLAILFLIAGLSLGLYVLYNWYLWYAFGAQTWPKLGSALVAVLFFSTSMMMLLMGVLLNTLLRVLKALKRLMMVP
jgi:dolichol-phosphate mannosyltransferase